LYSPTAQGVDEGAVIINYLTNAGDGQATAELVGISLVADLFARPVLDFGYVAGGGNSSQDLTLRNLGGTPLVVDNIEIVDDPDGVAERIVAGGGEILVPIEDRFYGKREGRVRDPFGHYWILSKDLQTLSVEELERRTAEWSG